ncbi:S8 family serine peptidase [Anaerolineales bacterium HSG24]|nr:S8 family serine peptidase [Anaerolineales bacterium HSG24]
MKKTTILLIVLMSLFVRLILVNQNSSAQELPPKVTPAPAVTPTGVLDPKLYPKIETELLNRLTTADGDTIVPFIAYLHDKTNLRRTVARSKPDSLSQRTAIVKSLKQTAQQSQRPVLGLLQRQTTRRNGQVITASNVRSLWIINAVAGEGSLATVLALADLPEVELVRFDKTVKLVRHGRTSPIIRNSAVAGWVPALLPEVAWGIKQIRADLVHTALGIDGHGVVIANVDTGVDWQHPALQSGYRGYTGLGHVPRHDGNWFDAIEGAVYPVDSNGHGTHTMGTIVGQEGIGVAPGATWIAARAFNNIGEGRNSWVHAAHQWLLAPNDDPSLAPILVNNSWSNSNGGDLEFEEDLLALRLAGVYMFFAAGNEGPSAGSIGSPASIAEVFSVGATDDYDEVASFSSRGPSYFGILKPEISAPGRDVYSTLPGGTYGIDSGTSMAVPHATGLAALILQTSPVLSQDFAALAQVITSTAMPLGEVVPNYDYGWGRIDAYNAVASVAPVGAIQGHVAENDLPLADATLTFKRRSNSETVQTISDADGFYWQGLDGGTYDVTAVAFGYVPTTAFNITVTNQVSVEQDFLLQPEPKGTLIGNVSKQGGNLPVVATVMVDGTPIQIDSQANDGQYRLDLPVGVYTVTVITQGYRINRQAVVIADSQTTLQNFYMQTAPTILLVDSGRWNQTSEIDYYQDTLTLLGYPHELWEVTNPFTITYQTPTVEQLVAYDIVVWSAPFDSPSLVKGSSALLDYLEQGGRLFISGQDIAYYDGGGEGFYYDYLSDYLKVKWIRDNAKTYDVVGAADGPFAGLSLHLAEGDGANNQTTPDVIANGDDNFALSLLHYDTGEEAGLYTGICVPYRAIYLAFGFEAIDNEADRLVVMQRSLDWLLETPSTTGLQIRPPVENLIDDFGEIVTHTIYLRNIGTEPDIYQINYQPGAWQTIVPPPTSTLIESCQTYTVTTQIQIDATKYYQTDMLTLILQSTNNQSLTEIITRTTQSPAPVLLVDDGRFLNFGTEYELGLTDNGILYDYWRVPSSWNGSIPPSPPLEVLELYPMVIWFTGYDWSTPLSTVEEERLAQYLDGGGRLFFSSQDYIYQLPEHRPSQFTTNYLGVQKHTEDFTSTLVMGQADSPVGAYLGPYPLLFPPGYNNWTDSLTPLPQARVVSRGQSNQINGLTYMGRTENDETWHTQFMTFGLELLAQPARNRFMQRSVGWLSWLGQSTVIASHSSHSSVIDGDLIAYTATIKNDGSQDISIAYFTATFPPALIPTPMSSELTPVGDQLVWQGRLAKDEDKTFKYTAQVAEGTPLGTTAQQVSWFSYPDHTVRFDRINQVIINEPDLTDSSFEVNPAHRVAPSDMVTYTLVLSNNSLVDVPVVTASSILETEIILTEVDSPVVGTVITSTTGLTWSIPVPAQQAVTLTYRAIITQTTAKSIETNAYIDDSVHEPIELTAWLFLQQQDVYLPILLK